MNPQKQDKVLRALAIIPIACQPPSTELWPFSVAKQRFFSLQPPQLIMGWASLHSVVLCLMLDWTFKTAGVQDPTQHQPVETRGSIQSKKTKLSQNTLFHGLQLVVKWPKPSLTWGLRVFCKRRMGGRGRLRGSAYQVEGSYNKIYCSSTKYHCLCVINHLHRSPSEEMAALTVIYALFR